MTGEYKLKPWDTIWLLMESADTPMHVGVLAQFTPPRNAGEDFLPKMAEAMHRTEPVAPWNTQLSGGINTRLVETEDFDIEYHFRRSALPAPGGERELGQIVSRLHSNPLDRARPLWEFHLIEGLENNRFAFYIKIHHAMVDSVNGVPALLAALSTNSRARKVQPLWAQPLARGDTDEDLVGGFEWPGIADSVESLASMGKAALGMVRGALKPSERNSFLFPKGTPRSTLNRRITTQRRFATQQFEQARIQQLADATDSTVNEVLTYLCGSSLRRFFKEYNVLPDQPLIGVMPVSLQERADHVAGNAIAGLRLPLATNVGDPLARLAAIKQSMLEVRQDRASLPEEAVTSYLLMRAAPVYASQLAGVGQFVPPLFNLAVSNTQGSDKPLYFNGARLEAVFPMSQLMQFGALSIDCVNYAGTFNIGITGAHETLPHLQRLAVYMGKALEDLEELAATGEVA